MRINSSWSVISAVLLAATVAGAADLPPSATPRPPEKVYAATCGYCHGTNVGPIILGRQLEPALVKRIARIGQNAMPALRPTEITDEELSALATWIQSSKVNPKEFGQ